MGGALLKQMGAAELYVTNFNPNFTGVSATAAGVVSHQSDLYNLRLVGHDLPDCPRAIAKVSAVRASRWAPTRRPFAIWHVRRNPEMRTAIWARDVLRLPIRIVFTSAAQRRHSVYPRWLISRMDAVIATTQKAAEFVPHMRAVVPHGVDTTRFRPPFDRARAWAELGYPGTRGIATIGRIRPEKGTDLFVDTMLRALPDLPDVTGLVIGKAASRDKAFLDDLMQRVAAAGMADRILFPGEIAAERMPALFQSLSLLVAMPRYEGYGMTPLEAMASGVPFVASDAGHFREFSCDGMAGRVVRLEDVEAAAEHVVRIMGSPDCLARMSGDAVTSAETQFGVAREVAGISAVYDALWEQEAT